MLEEETFDYFFAEGVITRTIRPIKSGKEASVVLCEAHPSTGREFIAIKQYRPVEERAFKNDARYLAGQLDNMEGRDRRALANKTRWGRQVQEAVWLGREWERLTELHEAGADVPEPLMSGPRAIAMEYIGNAEQAAPQLHRVRLDPATARRVFARIIENVELMLRNNLIHGDLSAFNILWWNERAIIIDFPQTVDARMSPSASDLLERDVANLCRHFERLGVRSNPSELARGLWLGFMFAEL